MRKTLALAVLAMPLAIAGCSHPQPVVYVLHRRPRSPRSRSAVFTMELTRRDATSRRGYRRTSIGIRNSATHPCLRRRLRIIATASAKATSETFRNGPTPAPQGY